LRVGDDVGAAHRSLARIYFKTSGYDPGGIGII
jgi:hypothetical protein